MAVLPSAGRSSPPRVGPTAVMGGTADQVGAMVFALGIQSAIIARERQGIGQHVDVSLLGSQVALQGAQFTRFLRGEVQTPTPQRMNPVFTYFRASDGLYLVIGLLDPKWWPELCGVLAREDLPEDARFATPLLRQEHREGLLAELDGAFGLRPRDEWLDLLRAADVPCAPVNDYLATSRDPQVLANGYITSLEHPSLGPVRVVGSPIQMSESVTGPRRTAPELGQHTEEVLLELGYDWGVIETLKDAEVV